MSLKIPLMSLRGTGLETQLSEPLSFPGVVFSGGIPQPTPSFPASPFRTFPGTAAYRGKDQAGASASAQSLKTSHTLPIMLIPTSPLGSPED